MNRKLASYGIALLVGLVTMVALAPASSAEHCWDITVEEAGTSVTVFDACEGPLPDHTKSDEAPGQAVNADVQASGPCWYVVVPEQDVGPASVAVYQCDPQVSVDSTSDATDLTAEHCWWQWDGQRYCTLTDFVEGVVQWTIDEATGATATR